MPEENQTPQNNAALAAAFNTVTPFSQIRTESPFEKGQYDFAVAAITPGTGKNGLYALTVELKTLAPSTIAVLPGKAGVFKRTLYVGTHKDKMAELPDTRLQSSAYRFLKSIAEANKLAAGDQSDAQFVASLQGKTFGVALVQGNDYEHKTEKNPDGTAKKVKGGLEFGRTITPQGVIPAKLEREASAATAAPAAAAPVGATFN